MAVKLHYDGEVKYISTLNCTLCEKNDCASRVIFGWLIKFNECFYSELFFLQKCLAHLRVIILLLTLRTQQSAVSCFSFFFFIFFLHNIQEEPKSKMRSSARAFLDHFRFSLKNLVIMLKSCFSKTNLDLRFGNNQSSSLNNVFMEMNLCNVLLP